MDEEFEEDSERKIIWLENLYTVEKIIETMESCDKDCDGCSRSEQIDCRLEMRECLHSIAIHFKKAILSMFENSGVDKVEQKPQKPPAEIFS